MNKSTLLALVSIASGLVFAADDTADWNDMVQGKTYLQYEHNFKTRDRRHGDSFKLVQKIENDWSWELKFSTNGGSGKNTTLHLKTLFPVQQDWRSRKGLNYPEGFH